MHWMKASRLSAAGAERWQAWLKLPSLLLCQSLWHLIFDTHIHCPRKVSSHYTPLLSSQTRGVLGAHAPQAELAQGPQQLLLGQHVAS